LFDFRVFVRVSKPDFPRIFCLSFKLFEHQTVRSSRVHCIWFILQWLCSAPWLWVTLCCFVCICENSLQELENFITEADKGLLTPVQEGDYEGLICVMGFLYHVRERQVTTNEMFEPIKEIINMLKIYDVEFSEETYLKLQVICFNPAS
jgi:hypothetical protein